MRKLYALLIAVLAIFTVSQIHAQTITIGTGTSQSSTSDNSGPIYRSSGTSSFNYSRHDMLYTASDLSALPIGATITEVAWYKTTAFTLSASSTATFNILMKNSSVTSLASQNWGTATTGATTVYTGTLTASDIPAAAGWVTFTLTTPFVYTGGSLEILTDWAVSGTSPYSTGAFQWQYTTATSTQARGTSGSSALTDASTLSSSYSRVMNLQLTYTPPPACTGTPDPGNTLSTFTQVCSGLDFTLSTQNIIAASGISYQWQSSSDGAAYANISGATSPTLTTTQTATTWYRVIVTCSNSGLSGTSTSIQVTQDFIAPTTSTETFDTYLPNGCWSEAAGPLGAPTTFTSTTASNWTSDDFGNVTSPANPSARLNIFGTTADEWLITPSYDLGTGGNLQMEFDLAYTTFSGTASATLGADDKFAVLISTDNGATWTSANTLKLWDASTPISNTGEHIVIDLSSYTGLVKFAFYGESTVSNVDNNVYVDNFKIAEIPACGPPTSVSVTNISNITADVSWTAPVPAPVTYEIYYSTTNTPPTSGTTPTATGITSASYNLTGLTGNTTYYVWVRSNCGGSGISEWTSLAATFTTLCDPLTTPTATPQTFEAIVPNVCWSEAQGDLGAPTTLTGTTSSWLSDDFANVVTTPENPSANLSISGTTTNEWLISESYDLGTGGNLQLEFDLALTGSANTNPASLDVDDKFVVLISTDNGTTWTSANILRQWDNTTPISNTGEHVSISLASYTGVVKFAFYGESTITNTTIEIFVDNLAVKTIPACSAPGAISFSNVTNSTATVNWTVPSPAPASYDIYYSTTNTAPTGGTTPTASGLTATTYNLTGLTGNTTYYVWVRSNCGGAGMSEWSVLPGQLTTLCDPLTTPTAAPQTFEAIVPNVCWSEAQGDLGAPTTFTATTSSWLSDDFANVTSPANPSANLALSGTLANEWLISESYDLGTSNNLQLEFDLALTTSGGTAATTLPTDDKFVVLISTDNGATWTSANILRQWDNSTPISNTGEHIVINLSAYTGVVKFAFYGESTVTNSTVEIFVDNMEVKTIPSCAVPGTVTMSAITNNSATATWVAASPAPTDYQIYYSTSSTDPTAGTTPIATGIAGLTYDLTGLTGNTTYYVWVRSNCAGTTSPWTALATQFATLCDAVSTFSENFDAVTTPALPPCWQKVGTSGSVQTQTANNNTPPNTLYIYSSSTSNIAMVAMPRIDNLGAGTHWLKFNMRGNISANGVIQVGYLTDPTDQSTFVAIQSVTAATTTYQEYTVMPGVIATSAEYLAFRHTGSPASSILIDDVRWEAMPACTGAVGGTATASAISYCVSGTPTITATGYSIGAISSYQWESSADNTTWADVSGATNPATFTPAAALTATTFFRLRVTCNSGTATDYSNTVTITINPLPTLTVSPAGPVVICAPASQLLEVTATSAANPTYQWQLNGTDISGATSSSYSASASGNYTVVVTDGNTTCSATSTAVAVTVNPQPSTVTISPTTPQICAGGTAQLLTASGGDVTVTGSPVTNTGTTAIAGNPYRTFYDGSKLQFIYTAAELSAAGLSAGSNITALAFEVTSAGNPILTLNISLGHTALATFPDGNMLSGLTTVFSGPHTPTVGVNTHSFTTPFVWNGTDNIVFEACFSANASSSSSTVRTVPSVTNSANHNAADATTCATATGTRTGTRPYIILSSTQSTTITWAPVTGLFTDAGATNAYTGGNTSTVYALPATTTVYTATATSGASCTNSSDVTVTINPLPTITLGANPSVCAGATSVDLAYTATTGNPDQYSIDFDAAAEAAGFVDVTNATLPTSPIAITVPGAATAATYNGTITVRNNAAGCNGTVSAPFTITVNANVTAGTVTGTTPLTAGASAQFISNGTTGGTWSSTNTSVATVDPATGMVTAVAAGTTDITYTVNSGCGSPVSSFLTLTVIPATTAGIVSGTSPLCIGQVATFTTTGTTGGTWSSTNTAVATVNATTGEVTAVAAGTTDITYTIAGNSSFMTLTVSPNVSAGTITGTTPLCIGNPVTFTSNGTAGGAWSSSNTAVATVDASTGEVTGVAAGTADITYTVSSGCGSPVSTFISITVDPNVSAGTITGTTPLCTGATSTFTTNGTAGGTWSSSNTAVATVDASTGEVTAVAAGTTDITYTVSSGCGSPASTTLSVTVNLAANAGTISGTSSLCVGATSALSTNGDAGGTWSSSNTAVATVDANTGLVTAVAAGSADIVYTISTGCGSPVTAQLTVNVNAGSSWTGATSTDWNTASNWCGGVPVNTSDVTIPAGVPNMPTISDVANVRDLTIATGATLTITSAGRLNIHGDYENDGTMDATAGTVAFQGATAQTADALEVANLIMNGAGGVTLNGNLTITGALTLTNGHITTGDHTVTINQGASGSLSSHIITSGNGTVVANNVGANAYSIPVSADAAGYNPITLTNGQGLNYTVKVATGIIPTILNPAIAINRTWGIVPSATPASPVTIALEYQDGQANASANPTANMEVGVHNGTNWTVISQPGGIAPTGPATARMITVQSTLMGAFVLSNVGGTTAVPVIDQDITSIQLMPNVVNGRSTLRVNVRRAMKIDWVVTDMNGRQVSRFTQQLMPGQTDLSLQFGNLPNGSYLLSGYSSKGKTEVLRFVKL